MSTAAVQSGPAAARPGPSAGRAAAELGAWAAAVGLVHLAATRPGSTLATLYILGLLAAVAWGLPTVLERPRLGLWLGRLTLLMGLVLAWQARFPSRPLPALPAPRNDFPGPAARVWHDLQPPAAWRGAPAEPWVYVGVVGAEPAEIMAAGPDLRADGRSLQVELDPWTPRSWLRARFPAELLGAQVRISFGFSRPLPALRVYPVPYYWGSVPWAPSSWSADGAPPPRGPELPRRRVGLLGRLAGQSPYAATLTRHAIELRLVDPTPPVPVPAGTERPRVLEGCY